jgi:gamma-glutamylcyclotransferase (GGCT)/AIG2-like uncharacterized protein YtfP
MADLKMERLFSYGTLRDEQVQRAVFGHPVEGVGDAITGWRLEPYTVNDPKSVAISGKSTHHILVRTESSGDEIAGTVFDITQDELRRADDYEGAGIDRVRVTLRSGTDVWMYVKATDAQT